MWGTRNTEMAELVPEFNDFLYDINDRVIDLMTPFVEGWYVDKDFFGSASIKAVLPVLVPELSYKALEIQEGGTAQRIWIDTVLGCQHTENRTKIFDDLRKYCELDTLAMVKIWEVLSKV